VLEDPQARIALAYLKAKTIKGLPIRLRHHQGFCREWVRHLKELRLWEVSVVTFPMQPSGLGRMG